MKPRNNIYFKKALTTDFTKEKYYNTKEIWIKKIFEAYMTKGYPSLRIPTERANNPRNISQKFYKKFK